MSTPPSFQPKKRRRPTTSSAAGSSGRPAPRNTYRPNSATEGAPRQDRYSPSSATVPPSYAPSRARRTTSSPQSFAPGTQRRPVQGTPPQVRPRPKNPNGLSNLRKRAPRWRYHFTAKPIVLALVAMLICWPLGLLLWANSKLGHTEALDNVGEQSGQTYLLAGSDERNTSEGKSGIGPDGTEGHRADSIMLIHKAANGQSVADRKSVV